MFFFPLCQSLVFSLPESQEAVHLRRSNAGKVSWQPSWAHTWIPEEKKRIICRIACYWYMQKNCFSSEAVLSSPHTWLKLSLSESVCAWLWRPFKETERHPASTHKVYREYRESADCKSSIRLKGIVWKFIIPQHISMNSIQANELLCV